MAHLTLASFTAILCGMLGGEPHIDSRISIVQEAAQQLRRALAKGNEQQQAELLESLLCIRHKVIAELVITKLDASSERIRILAASCRSVPVDRKVRRILKRGLDFSGRFPLETLRLRHYCAVRLAAAGHPAGIDFLKDACHRKGFQERLTLLGSLIELGDCRFKSCALAMLRDDRLFVRVLAAAALAEMGDRRAVHVLYRALRDERGELAGYAAQALAHIGAEEALPDIRKLAQSDDAILRVTAAKALAMLGDTQGISVLLAALEVEPQTAEEKLMRLIAIEYLGNVGTTQALPVLKGLLRSSNESDRVEAAIAIINILSRSARDLKPRSREK